MKLLKTYGAQAAEAEAAIVAIEQRGAANTAKVEPVVRQILDRVRSEGDAALLELAVRFDGLASGAASPAGMLVSQQEMQAAWDATEPALQQAMSVARRNIRAFAEAQKPAEWQRELSPGVKTGQVVRPLGSVGCYVPGGRYPLPSTLLMTVTPAQVAGIARIVVCSPRPARETLAAAWLAGVTEFYRIGGAQAVAALAFGTQTVRPVDKIVGPGNLYVTAAKLAVAGVCGIDMPAGPTEIGIASVDGDAESIAADLVAQAEHDPEALAVFLTPNLQLAEAVRGATLRQAEGNALAEESLAAQGFLFVTPSVTDMQTLTNRLAFEHLTVDADQDVAWVQNAGSIFVGPYSPQSMGDYVSGPNHVLPTGRAGRVRGGLSVMDFVKVITVQEYTRAGLDDLGPHAVALAEAEGLEGHAASVRNRMQTERASTPESTQAEPQEVAP